MRYADARLIGLVNINFFVALGRGRRAESAMKLRLLLGLAFIGLLCGCGSSGGGGQPDMPNSSRRIAPQPIAAHAAAHRK